MMMQSNELINRANDMIANRYNIMKAYEMEQGFWDSDDYIVADKIIHNIRKPIFSLLTDLLK